MPYIGRPIGVAGHTTQKLDDPTGISSNAFTMKVATVAISPDAASLQIYVDGVRQEAGVAYTVSGSTITFTGTFTSSNDFQGYVMGDAMYIQTNSVDSDHYVDGSIDNAHLADDAVDSDELAAGAVDLAHMSVNSIDSDQYVDGSIYNAHLADDAVDSDELAAGSVDIAHLSASGTAGSGNFLRGDNSWTAVTSPAITAITGTAANQILTDDGDGTVTSEANITYDGTTFTVNDQFSMGSGTGGQFTETARDSAYWDSGDWKSLADVGGSTDGIWLTFGMSTEEVHHSHGIVWYSANAGATRERTHIGGGGVSSRWDGDNIQVQQDTGTDTVPVYWVVYRVQRKDA